VGEGHNGSLIVGQEASAMDGEDLVYDRLSIWDLVAYLGEVTQRPTHVMCWIAILP
jgi:hypothetical protein